MKNNKPDSCSDRFIPDPQLCKGLSGQENFFKSFEKIVFENYIKGLSKRVQKYDLTK